MPVISIFQKIENKALSLTGYFVGEPHCRAFNFACRFQPDAISQIILNNNGLKDHGLSLIFDGLAHLVGVKKIIVIDNEFGVEALASFRRLVSKKNTHLDELRLSNCRMRPEITIEVLADIYSTHMPTLRKLSIVNGSLNKESLKTLLALLKESKVLMDLDISYNHLPYAEMAELISCISTNRRLQFLNMSWNSIGIKVYNEPDYGDINPPEINYRGCFTGKEFKEKDYVAFPEERK